MTMKHIKLIAAVAAACGAMLAMPAHAGKTLDAVKARGQIVCGVSTGLAGFSQADSSGKWTGLDVDVCRAVAAAVLSDADKSNMCRFPPSNVLPLCNPAKSMYCHATPRSP